MIQRARPSNPNRSEQNIPGVTITAHHVVQYQLLSKFFDRPGIMAQFVPKRAEVSLAQLSNLNLVPQLQKLDLGPLPRSPELGSLSAATLAETAGLPAETKSKLEKAIGLVVQAGKNPMKGGDEIYEIARAFFAWAPANLFHGPEPKERDWDPDGDNGWDAPDTDAQYFLEPDHYQKLVELRATIRSTVGQPPGKVDRQVTALFKKLATEHNTVTPYEPDDWTTSSSGHQHPSARAARTR